METKERLRKVPFTKGGDGTIYTLHHIPQHHHDMVGF